MSAAGAAILYEGVGKRFGAAEALSDFSASIAPGCITGLVGPDGAGKTTLLRLACGLLAADAGRVAVIGADPAREPLRIQASVGYMPQRFGLYEDLSVQENLDLYADLRGVAAAERPGRYEALLRMTALAPFSRRLAGALSGGMKQKLGLACSLLGFPRILLLDEPTAGVDPVSRRELWAIVGRLAAQQGITVLLATAYLDEAERCAEVILLDRGRAAARGAPAELRRRVEGRVFSVAHAALSRRELQQRLAGGDGVVDVMPRGAGVEVTVTEDAAQIERLLPGAAIQPRAARFEDAFMLLLRGKARTPALLTAASHPPSAAPVDPAEAIVVRDLKRRFGDFYAVKGVSFTVRRGEVFGLLGANGAGKSTTFRMLCGLLPITAGQALVAGLDLARAAADARSRIGYMAQRFSLYGDLSVLENLEFFGAVYGLGRAARRARISWALEQFELTRFAGMMSGELPLGYKQRLGMAAALMHEPEILFLDEPTSGVDPLARREFWLRIAAFAQGGVTVLVTTHFMEEAEYCDRLVLMDAGEVLAEGSPAELKARVKSAGGAEPSMEEAFIGLLEAKRGARA